MRASLRIEPRSVRALSAHPWRAVESQHIVGTRKLVDSDWDHEVLERLIEGAKPALAPDCAGLHYLLATPLRYPPLRHGSRFGGRFERGIWYGSESLAGAFAEVAYYRLVFLEGTRADLEPVTTELSAFRARVSTRRAVDLTRAPFDAHRRVLSSPTSYRASQRLGHELRARAVEALRYASARQSGALHVAVLAPAAFSERVPSEPEPFVCTATRAFVELRRKSWFVRESLRFEREQFLVRGVLPKPAL